MKTALLLGLVLGCSAPATWERPGLGGAVRPEMGGPQPNTHAPAFELPSDGGGTVSLGSLRGFWVVLHFTASWCPYCDSEVAHLGEMAERYGDRGVRVVLVDEKEDEAKWRAYASAHVSKRVVSLRDPDGTAAVAYAPPRAQPSFADRSQVVLDATLLVDPDGMIRLFLLPDTAHFDPTFVAVRGELDRLLASEPVQVSVGDAPDRCGLVAKLGIAPGYHVQSHTPRAPELIATTVEAVGFGPAEYPTGDTYERATDIALPCAGPRPRDTAVTVSYQACTRTRCLFPTQRRIENRGTP